MKGSFANIAKAQVKQRTMVVEGARLTFLARILTQFANPYGARVRVKGDTGEGYYFELGWLMEQDSKRGLKSLLTTAIECAIEKRRAEVQHGIRESMESPITVKTEGGVKKTTALLDRSEDEPMITGQEIARVLADGAACECPFHRYHVVHIFKDKIYDHSQANFDTVFKNAECAEVESYPSGRYAHGDTPELLRKRARDAQAFTERPPNRPVDHLPDDDKAHYFCSRCGTKRTVPAEQLNVECQNCGRSLAGLDSEDDEPTPASRKYKDRALEMLKEAKAEGRMTLPEETNVESIIENLDEHDACALCSFVAAQWRLGRKRGQKESK